MPEERLWNITIKRRERPIMRVGICDDDVRWCQTAKEIIQEYGKKTDHRMRTCIALRRPDCGRTELERNTGTDLYRGN